MYFRLGMDLPVHGDGLATRSYLYVEDVAEAYICILLKGQVRRVFCNIVNCDSIYATMKKLAVQSLEIRGGTSKPHPSP